MTDFILLIKDEKLDTKLVFLIVILLKEKGLNNIGWVFGIFMKNDFW